MKMRQEPFWKVQIGLARQEKKAARAHLCKTAFLGHEKQ